MAMLRWEPFREMENALRRFSPLYMPDNGTTRDEPAVRTWIPLANISESESEYLIKVELPDVKKEDVKIAVADGVITISGAKGINADAKDGVLRIHIPKAKTKKSEPLAIEVH